MVTVSLTSSSHTKRKRLKKLTIEVVGVAVGVAGLAVVVAGRRGQREMVRIAAHGVPLLEQIGRPLHHRVPGQPLRIARIPRHHLLQPLQPELDGRRLAAAGRVVEAAGRVPTELLALEFFEFIKFIKLYKKIASVEKNKIK